MFYIYASLISYGLYAFTCLYMILINPGIPSINYIEMVYKIRKNDSLNESISSSDHYKWCNKCHIFSLKKDRVKHCDECNICIFNFDHHCGFSGKCVGAYNYLIFYVFAFISFVLVFVQLGFILIGLLNSLK